MMKIFGVYWILCRATIQMNCYLHVPEKFTTHARFCAHSLLFTKRLEDFFSRAYTFMFAHTFDRLANIQFLFPLLRLLSKIHLAGKTRTKARKRTNKNVSENIQLMTASFEKWMCVRFYLKRFLKRFLRFSGSINRQHSNKTTTEHDCCCTNAYVAIARCHHHLAFHFVVASISKSNPSIPFFYIFHLSEFVVVFFIECTHLQKRKYVIIRFGFRSLYSGWFFFYFNRPLWLSFGTIFLFSSLAQHMQFSLNKMVIVNATAMTIKSNEKKNLGKYQFSIKLNFRCSVKLAIWCVRDIE